jgi:hypothetical protein
MSTRTVRLTVSVATDGAAVTAVTRIKPIVGLAGLAGETVALVNQAVSGFH